MISWLVAVPLFGARDPSDASSSSRPPFCIHPTLSCAQTLVVSLVILVVLVLILILLLIYHVYVVTITLLVLLSLLLPFAYIPHSSCVRRRTGAPDCDAGFGAELSQLTWLCLSPVSGPETSKRKQVTRKADGKPTLLVNLGRSWHEKLTILATRLSSPI